MSDVRAPGEAGRAAQYSFPPSSCNMDTQLQHLSGIRGHPFRAMTHLLMQGRGVRLRRPQQPPKRAHRPRTAALAAAAAACAVAASAACLGCRVIGCRCSSRSSSSSPGAARDPIRWSFCCWRWWCCCCCRHWARAAAAGSQQQHQQDVVGAHSGAACAVGAMNVRRGAASHQLCSKSEHTWKERRGFRYCRALDTWAVGDSLRRHGLLTL